MLSVFMSSFIFNDPATTELYTLSLHDALPISCRCAGARRPRARGGAGRAAAGPRRACRARGRPGVAAARSEEHTSELQSRRELVCRLLLEKKNNESEHRALDSCRRDIGRR